MMGTLALLLPTALLLLAGCNDTEHGVRIHVNASTVSTVPAVDASDCCAACVSVHNCTTWSFGWALPNRCHLSPGAPIKRFADPAFTGGTKAPPPPPPIPPPMPPSPSPPLPPAAGIKPHVVFLISDDVGHANLGFMRAEDGTTSAEVSTPALDALATVGVRLGRFYTYRVCSPTRSSFQSGRLPVHVNTDNCDPAVHNPADPISGFAGIPWNMTCIANKLSLSGYTTHQLGKWDVGM